MPLHIKDMLDRNLIFFAALFTIIVSVGCRVPVRTIQQPADTGKLTSSANAQQFTAEWWRTFSDPILDDLINRALSGNFSLRATEARLRQARATARQAGAPLFPAVDLSSGFERRATRSEQTTTVSSGDGGGRGGGGETTSRTSFETEYSSEYSFGLSATYELDVWGRIRSSRDAARLDAEASAEDLQAAAITLSANVANTWYQLVEQAGQVNLLKKQIATTSDTLRIITYRFNQGQSAASDVLQQKQLLESRFEELERAKSQLRALELSLDVLLGYNHSETESPEEKVLINIPQLPDGGVPFEMLKARPDVRSDFLAIQAADQRVASAVADLYPRLSLTAGYNTNSDEFSDLFDNWVANIAANLLAPIFDGGRRRGEVARTRAVALERFYTYGQTLRQAFADAQTALNNEEQQRKIVARIETQLRLATQVTEAIRAEYLRGTSEYLRVLDAQISQQNLERELLTARRNLIGFRIDLHRALADGWDIPSFENTRDILEAGFNTIVTPRAEDIYPLPIPLPGSSDAAK
jgi:NodT family efflux transporter outer membrane factor (OMF) lipoprotein